MSNNEIKQLELTVEMAKEMYETASEAVKKMLEVNFTPEELGVDNRPRKFGDLGYIGGFYFHDNKIKYSHNLTADPILNPLAAPTIDDIESYLAKCQLLQLAKALNDGEVNKEWINNAEEVFFVDNVNGSTQYKKNFLYTVCTFYISSHRKDVLFKREEDALFSLKHHRKLWLQYFMLDADVTDWNRATYKV